MSQSFRPRVENLADRCVPAAQVTQVGTILRIVGDPGTSNIFINDNGGRDNAITVTTESGSFTSRGRVVGIQVFAGLGRDRVFYSMTGQLQQGQARNIFIDMGGGTLQLCNVNVQAGLAASSALNVNVRGGVDSDRLLFNSSGTISGGSVMRVQQFGGPGADTVVANVSGVIDGAVLVRGYGGSFYDAVRSNVTASSGSGGAISTKLYGEDGDDVVSLLATKQNLSDRLGFEFTTDGGAGTNRGTRTGNVVPFNIHFDDLQV